MTRESGDERNKRRRTILKAIGANAASVGVLSESVHANDRDGQQMNQPKISEIKGRAQRRLLGKARGSDHFRLLYEEIVVGRGFTLSDRGSKVFHRISDEDSCFVVSVPVEHPQRTDIKNAGICIVLDRDESFQNAAGTVGYETANESTVAKIESFRVVDGSVNTESKRIPEDGSAQEANIRSTTYCSPCQELYGIACEYGCYIGYGSLCAIFTGGIGSVYCTGIVAALCDYIDENSCDETSYVACKIIGYC